jgi:hypothetical protein
LDCELLKFAKFVWIGGFSTKKSWKENARHFRHLITDRPSAWVESTATRAGTTIRLRLLLLTELEPDQAAKRVNFNGISFLAYR